MQNSLKTNECAYSGTVYSVLWTNKLQDKFNWKFDLQMQHQSSKWHCWTLKDVIFSQKKSTLRVKGWITWSVLAVNWCISLQQLPISLTFLAEALKKLESGSSKTFFVNYHMPVGIKLRPAEKTAITSGTS